MDLLVQPDLQVHKELHQLLQVLLDTQALLVELDLPVHKVYKVILVLLDQLEPQVQKVFVDLQDYKVQLVLQVLPVLRVQLEQQVRRAYQLIFVDQHPHLLLYLQLVTQPMMRT
jgi:L-fucose mutarotase/ribose pyranase (RbsD/FucU family)